MPKILAFYKSKSFPVPFPDETLYSVIARYHVRSRNKTLSATAQTLFGNSSAKIVVDLPNKLNYLVSKLPQGSSISVDRLINNHTLYPFYAPFLPSHRTRQLYLEMSENSSAGSIHASTGMLTSGLNVEFLRYCPICFECDYDTYGEPYWHREHQIPGVLVCPHHSVFLESSSIFHSLKSRKESLISAKQTLSPSVPRYLDLKNESHSSHIYLAQQIYWLLQQKEFKECGPEPFHKKFLKLLFKHKLASYNWTVDLKQTHNKFAAFYSNDFLSSISCELNNRHTWLKRLIQNSTRTQHPIRNILLMNFLGVSVEEFLNLSVDFYPFGKPPFPCLSPATPHYGKLTISKFIVRRWADDRRKLYGTFECECGFIYRRYCDFGDSPNIFKYDSIASLGNIFVDKIVELSEKNFSMNEIADRLGIPISTVKKKLKIGENGQEVRHSNSAEDKLLKIHKQRNSFRQQWKQLQLSHPELGRTELRKANPSVGNWLYVNDMQWLSTNSPPKANTSAKKIRNDWKKRDSELSSKVEKISIELLTSQDKPVRVTKHHIATALNFNHILSKRPECIPQTILTLDRFCESIELFIVRRIRFVTRCFIEEKKSARYWDLLERAGLQAPHLVQLPEVQKAIKESLEKIDNLYRSGWSDL